jgi:site-specific recombinase XerD
LVGLDLNDLYFDCAEPYITVLAKGEQDEDFKEEVPVNKSAVKAVEDYLTIRNKYYPNSISNAIFLSDENSRLTKDGVSNMFEHYSNKEITPHMLRHYVGTKLYEFSGNDIHEVQDQLGHADINTSANSYVAVNKKKRYDALNMI